MKRVLALLFVIILSSATTIIVHNFLLSREANKPLVYPVKNASVNLETTTVSSSNYAPSIPLPSTLPNFREAAIKSTPTVVHITNTQNPSSSSSSSSGIFDLFDFFNDDFYGRSSEKVATGSGVIMSRDGYIVTNWHVVENAKDIRITLYDKREFTANLVGKDEPTDLAVLKINAKGLKATTFGNSNDVQVGDWVLAVGNPFNLASTVTAGIVSAKGRDINSGGTYSIESYIQTDAAVNSGNSGGALINTKGNLVGINSAIATLTGSYAGYSFAVPVNIVRKVVEDIIDYGIVQRGVLGVVVSNIDHDMRENLGLNNAQGVFLKEVVPGKAADIAGLQSGDVITEIGGVPIGGVPQLHEVIEQQYSPGDNFTVAYIRNRKKMYSEVQLRNVQNTSEPVTDEFVNLKVLLGTVFEELDEAQLKQMKIRNGILLKELGDGLLRRQTYIKPGFVVMGVNNLSIDSVETFYRILDSVPKGDSVLLRGYYPASGSFRVMNYAFTMQ